MSGVERGVRNASLASLERIAEALDVPSPIPLSLRPFP
ncbi:MAG: hypothetical protein WAL84_10555 [Candidatus Dormiibacterota bacterium]